MNETIARYRDRLSQWWSQTGKKQKIWLGGTLGFLILAIILLTYIFSRTDYEIAFQNLDTTDSAAVMTYLDSSGIKYQLSSDGKSILVPSAVASRVKIDVGSQGLVRNGSIGFDSFNQNSSQWGTTDNEFNVKYRNALNGEVQQLLNNMQGVESSKVLVTLPQESVFADREEEHAIASITLKFTNGYRPSQKEVDGYFKLVKTAVPNLAIDDITIASTEGELVSSEAGGSPANGGTEVADQLFQIQRKYETELKKNIQQYLSTMIGEGNVAVYIASSLNFDQKTSEQNLVEPIANNNNKGVVLSEQETSKTSTNTDSAVGGVPGSGETDVPGYTAANGAGNSSNEETSSIRNYEINRIKNIVESSPFMIKDLNISIGVNRASLQGEAQTQITNYVKQILRTQLAQSGLDVTSDSVVSQRVTVMAQDFAAGGAGSESSKLSTAWMAGIGIAALALIAGFAIGMMRKRKRNAEIAAAEAAAAADPVRVEFPTLDLDSGANDHQVRKNLETLAKRKPEEFVNLLRTWLVDE
ncbi:flagellar M-ring protein FliF [Paenibacillus curdlanolyticus YK9]|uniref:Flagellar M-ring protein n=1 Tax=Paenibacillus curdlanolyticus YK9 TaxID=717606 RepID=E0I440_9BACL|nr:flagellar basal-body MS-ring/collar protein FliF [Paenibacillus curdlanolyticus]EFM13054.1 flagellar M-ring protein FliF [Paenibacillus curdlanolyticus YK9]